MKVFKCKTINLKGKIEGKPFIPNFTEGDILISSMLTPDFIIYSRKIRAVITEKASLLCHAIIIANELKIPCAIGVKGVTEYVKRNKVRKIVIEKDKVIIL